MRTPVVSRTFKTTIINGLFVNAETRETFEKEFTLPRPFKTEKDIEKCLKKTNLFAENEKLVTILTFHVEDRKYVMTEDKFIANADVVNDTKN